MYLLYVDKLLHEHPVYIKNKKYVSCVFVIGDCYNQNMICLIPITSEKRHYILVWIICLDVCWCYVFGVHIYIDIYI